MWINENTLGIFSLHTDIRYEAWKSNTFLPAFLTDEVLSEYGYQVIEEDIPLYDRNYQKAVPSETPIKENGTWKIKYTLVDLDAATIANNLNIATVMADQERKFKRAKDVEAIKVTTTAGNTFDGDEVSQGRMSRAIIALQAAGVSSTQWVLADNTVLEATVTELTEALILAGQAQSAIWIQPKNPPTSVLEPAL